MVEAETASRVWRNLRKWPGFSALEQAMETFPLVDIYLAGGALRDAFSSNARRPKDYDFFIRGRSSRDFVKELGSFGRLSFGPFGSPRWAPSAGAEYADLIFIDAFNNGLSPCSSMSDALRQFDFTANAIGMNLRSGQVFDVCNGIRDAQDRIMRAVRLDYPNEPIREGANISRLEVLWIRLQHYSRILDYQLHPQTETWLRQNQDYRSAASRFSALFFAPDLP